MKSCLKTLLLAVSMVLSAVAPATADLIIDNYVAGDTILKFGAGSIGQTTSDGSIYGGTRIETLNVPDLGGDESLGVVIYGGSLSIAQGALDQINGSLLYDGFSTTDFTEGGVTDRFAIELVGSSSSSEMANVLSITATSGSSSQEVFLTVPGNGDLPQFVYAYFADFTKIDLAQIDAVTLSYDFQSAPGQSVTIGSFSTTIPEPGGLAVLLPAIMLLMRRRQRREV